MAKTFFFYDLETSGLSARDDRIMQFAGIRTDENFQQVGEPYNLLVQLNDDVLPSPDALMVTSITPQKTLDEGYTEAEFCKIITEDVFTPDTCAVGYNNIRFDDEFVRHILWRNFYDPYEWSWKDGRSRWDLLDVVRMTRALRPDGINWPVVDGKATNRLELITKENGIAHENAHDALADVNALIDVTKLIHSKQPQLFDYLLQMRDKKKVLELVNLDDKKPFVYVSGRYDAAYDKATVAFPLTSGPNGSVLVYDLRHDPEQFVELDEKVLAKRIFATREERTAEAFVALPVKTLQYNRCPAVAPLGVLTQNDGWKRIRLNEETIERHKKVLLAHPEFAERLRTIYEAKKDFKKSPDPEAQLYDGFLGDRDRVRVEAVRNASVDELADFHPEFSDPRLPELLLHYKARSFPRTLSGDEQKKWDDWRAARLQYQLPGFMKRLTALATGEQPNDFMIEELRLWTERVLPTEVDQRGDA
ncbi:MAG TPA: exodeoxyribonuclease I [Candidatus Saccharimonadaceae bacterium]|nr:exodeoxyribonuclease I [Candidatus Saccharimonadaceae bacterium]